MASESPNLSCKLQEGQKNKNIIIDYELQTFSEEKVGEPDRLSDGVMIFRKLQNSAYISFCQTFGTNRSGVPWGETRTFGSF